jgi:hypothetical protein
MRSKHAEPLPQRLSFTKNTELNEPGSPSQTSDKKRRPLSRSDQPSFRLALDRDRRRINGIYYTPNLLAEAMVTWIIRSRVDTLLEPSFGACGFLIPACLRLNHLGCWHPLGQAAGCDIDPAAFQVLATLAHPVPPPRHFLNRDFLTVSPSDFAIGKFSCLLSNPPFTRHQRIPPETKKALAANTESNGVRLPKRRVYGRTL